MKLFKILIFALLIISCSEKQKTLESGNYRINGAVTGMDNGEIYMYNRSKIDTIKVINGKFQIENKLEEVVSQLSFVKDPNQRGMSNDNNLSLFIEPVIMDLNIDYSDFSKSKLTGSKTQDEQYELDTIRAEIAKDYQKEIDEFERISQKYNNASKAGASDDELEAIKYEDNEARENLEPMWEKQGEATLEFIKSNPKSYVSVQGLLFRLSDMTYTDAKAIYDQFNPEHLKIGMAIRLAKAIEDMRKGIPGALAGNFDTVDINGESIKLTDFKGQYLLIDFWASWCVPCRKGNPHLLQQYAKYKSKGLEILGVSDDDNNHSAWRKAVEKDKIGVWKHVLRGATFDRETMQNKSPEKDISDGYNISTLPTKILIGPEGIIIGRYGGGGGSDEDMDNDLARIFGK